MAIDNDKLQELLGEFVGDLSATVAARQRGDRAQPRPVPGASGRARDRRGTGQPHRHQPAVCGRVAARPGGRRLRPVRSRIGQLLDDRGAGVRADRPGRRRVRAGRVRAGARRAAGRATDHRGVPDRRRHGLARARQRRVHRLRAVLPARLHRQPDPSWIPALDGVHDKLTAGAKVADIGCGLGASTILLAQAYPKSRFTGSDYHDGSIELARKRAGDAGVADRVSFEVSSASSFSGTSYDLAATFDCLHDMGDPLAAARHIRQALKPDGTWLVVEPYAADDIAGNLNPVGRAYYNFSTLLCVPNALSQPGGYALGAQAGQTAIRQVATGAGFTRFRRAAEIPFNLVYEVRP
jgi:ubiquinone/menaquinone biosynthesis C-methylase UbiE